MKINREREVTNLQDYKKRKYPEWMKLIMTENEFLQLMMDEYIKAKLGTELPARALDEPLR